MNPITEPFFSLLWAGAATTSSGGKEPVEAEYDALRCIDEAAKSM